ncbi:GGDEF domain-containing protein [Amycolatopsis sp. RTGN1]|uniref:GGDEF domain-containing protein n=1 Tax=Amycolatopsis ponsaeliensis TaxID=2992142 RepID=UPI002550430D|nr:GGDEF domain-containing protein [Amycolatopsis sp. RTGN1]
MWSLPRHVLTYVLAVDILAVATTGAMVPVLPVTRADGVAAIILGICAIAHIELSRSIERARKLTSGVGPFVDSLTLWDFAAVIVLPPAVASGLIVFTHTIAWLRVWRGRRPLYRWVFSDATVLLATQAAALVLLIGPAPHPGVPAGLGGLAIILVAAIVRWFVNYALVVGAILISSPGMRAGQVIGEFGEQIIEAGALGLGLGAAGLLKFNPWLLAGIVIGLLALHRGVLLAQYRTSSRTDDKTGLHSADWWHQIAERTLDRARIDNVSLAVLMIDLDLFKKINDTYGHPAGDDVLRVVAHAIESEVRHDDAAGRWGGEEFIVLLPGVDGRELGAIAERIRRRIHVLVIPITTDHGPTSVTDLTVSIGGALWPSAGLSTVDDMVLAADSNLYAAKDEGRNRVKLPDGLDLRTADDHSEPHNRPAEQP